ncbi:unnamed protein product [Rotaria socialis]|uniref:PiggyBac transposable element-derived protein domain-containing protein n=1 Tax=Rotaria socialis TaxID=392032 RepID=A0A821ETZ0_9BILA|nr:unnamed protein product [Rotaria socialis]
MIKITHALRVELNISDRSSTNNSEESSSKESESEENESEEKVENNNRKSKKRKTLHWTKRNFVTPAADFGDNLSPPPDNDELEPIDYFHFMLGKQSISLLTNQSNLYSVQKDPNKPVRISETEMAQFIGILMMTGIYAFPEQRFFWSSTTRVECISSVMSRDRFLEIKKYLHVADNSVQLDRDDPNFDRAHKVRPLLNIIKENFRTISKEEKLSVDEQIKPFKVGTVRPNRLLDLTMKTAKDLSSNGREAMDHRVTEVEGVELCVTRWYDNNVVNYLSTLHGCQPIDSVQRWSSKEKTHVLIARPNVIKAYNEHMGGVDLVDMLISLYHLSVVNVWLLYRRHCSQLKRPQKNVMSLLSFRINVASVLLKSSPPSPPIIKRGRPSLESRAKLNESQSTNTLRTAPTPIPPSSTRFDKFDHWPITTSKGRCRD